MAGRRTPDIIGGVRITPPCPAGRRARRERQEELSSDEEDVFQSPGRGDELTQAPFLGVYGGQCGEAAVEEGQEAAVLLAQGDDAAEVEVVQAPVPPYRGRGRVQGGGPYALHQPRSSWSSAGTQGSRCGGV